MWAIYIQYAMMLRREVVSLLLHYPEVHVYQRMWFVIETKPNPLIELQPIIQVMPNIFFERVVKDFHHFLIKEKSSVGTKPI
jgi:hypothetical protein